MPSERSSARPARMTQAVAKAAVADQAVERSSDVILRQWIEVERRVAAHLGQGGGSRIVEDGG